MFFQPMRTVVHGRNPDMENIAILLVARFTSYLSIYLYIYIPTCIEIYKHSVSYRSEGGDRETHADGHLSNDRVEDAGSAPVRGTQRAGGDSFANPGRMLGKTSGKLTWIP